MKQIESISKQVLDGIERDLRKQINDLAEARNYRAIVFSDKGHPTMGDVVKNGLESRWLNVLRVLSGEDFSIYTMHNNLDPETMRLVYKALP